MHRFDRRLGLTLPRAERTEIMGTDKTLRGLAHALDIQRPMIPRDLFGHMRRANLVVIDHITVTPRLGTKTRIKVRRHRFRPRHADITRQIHIRAHDPSMHGALDRRTEMHNLGTGVHQCIGTPGTAQGYGNAAGDFRKGFFQRFLN